MLGNWATGKLRIVSEPTSTRTIEMTMATMGRLMKNFDMRSPILRCRGKWFCVYMNTRTHLLNALGDDSVAGTQSAIDNPIGPAAVAERNRADAYCILVIDYRYLIAALQFGNGALRNH